jgi:hypothetical protein
MAPLAPPISIHLTRRQLRWLDSRRRLRSSLSRSAALRQAIDALIQQQEGSSCPSDPAGAAATPPRQLELTASSTNPAGEG